MKANAKKAKKKIEKRTGNETQVGIETEIEMERIHLQEHIPGVSDWADGNDCLCYSCTNAFWRYTTLKNFLDSRFSFVLYI